VLRVSRREEGGGSDSWGPVDRETRERRPAREGVIRKGKRISREDATDARAGWAGRDGFGHAMHPIQDLFLESFSYVRQFDMHFFMHSYVDNCFLFL
jgi:hypothetical protein